MSMRSELADPWGWLLAGISGGLGWAVLAAPLGPAAIAVGAGIGAAVLGTKVALGGSRGERRRRPTAEESRRPDTLPVPHPASPAGQLLARAQVAVDRIQVLSETSGDPWLRSQVGSVDDDAAEAAFALRELGGRITLVEQSLAAGDPRRLAAERARLAAAIQSAADPRLAAEQQRTVAAIDQQLMVADRLATLRQTLLARMETAVLGLEGLSARMGEVVALGPTAVDHDRAADLIGGLTTELDTLRGGIAEAQALSVTPPVTPPVAPPAGPPMPPGPPRPAGPGAPSGG